jgi:hypothetical protein
MFNETIMKAKNDRQERERLAKSRKDRILKDIIGRRVVSVRDAMYALGTDLFHEIYSNEGFKKEYMNTVHIYAPGARPKDVRVPAVKITDKGILMAICR